MPMPKCPLSYNPGKCKRLHARTRKCKATRPPGLVHALLPSRSPAAELGAAACLEVMLPAGELYWIVA